LTALARALADEAKDELDAAHLLHTWIYASLAAEGDERPNQEACRGDQLCIDEQSLLILDGNCSYRASLMITVLASLGISSRHVEFDNIPVQTSHTTVEVLADGSWHFFDPSFGLYFAGPSSLTTPFSIAEARRRFPDVSIQRTRAQAWTRSWVPMATLRSLLDQGGYETIPAGPMPDPRSGPPVADAEQSYFSSAMYIEGQSDSYVQKLVLDVRSARTGGFGEEDHSLNDLTQYDPETSYGRTYFPWLYVLGTSWPGHRPNVSDELLVLSDRPGVLRFSVVFLSTVSPEVRRHFVGRVNHAVIDYTLENHLLSYDWGDDRVTISFGVEAPLTIARISLGEAFGESSQLLLDSIRWSFEAR